MDISILAVGKQKAGPELDLLNRYVKQTRWKVSVHEYEDKKAGSVSERMAREGEALLAKTGSDTKVVVLDERGKTMGSADFAKMLKKWEDEGVSHTAFLIGGADGHGDAVRQQADVLLAFGQMTWPHMLVRVMLAEQIYRAKTIVDGHPYHRA